MRTLIAATALVLLSTPGFASCEHMRPSSPGVEAAAQAAYAACLQAELARNAIDEARLRQIEADQRLQIQLLQRQFEQQMLLQQQQLQLQQQMAAPSVTPFI